jgi:hypothetical protein
VIDDRIAERRKGVREERRRSRLRRTIAVVLAVVLLAVLVVVERSALVGLEEIHVTGVERLEAEQVREATGLELGTSTLRLRLSRVEQRVQDLPAVREVEARRVDPLTVVVDVVERRPSLVVEGGGERVLVDREGVVLAGGGQAGLPRVVLDEAPPEPGGSVADDPALANAFRGWRGLTGPLRAQVSRYLAGGPDDLVLRLESGVDVRIGRADRLDEKVRAMGVILEDIGEAEINEIDVRAPSAPFVVD